MENVKIEISKNTKEAQGIFKYLIDELNQEVSPTCKEIGMDRSYYYKIQKGENISTKLLNKCREYAEIKGFNTIQQNINTNSTSNDIGISVEEVLKMKKNIKQLHKLIIQLQEENKELKEEVEKLKVTPILIKVEEETKDVAFGFGTHSDDEDFDELFEDDVEHFLDKEKDERKDQVGSKKIKVMGEE